MKPQPSWLKQKKSYLTLYLIEQKRLASSRVIGNFRLKPQLELTTHLACTEFPVVSSSCRLSGFAKISRFPGKVEEDRLKVSVRELWQRLVECMQETYGIESQAYR